VVQLAEQGKLDFDAPVTLYLPYFRLDDPRYSQITVRQMLNHTSGMPDVVDYEWDSPQVDEGAAERYVRSLASEKMIAAPGERRQYSNMAFDTLGDVIAKVSGVPFETYVDRQILDPLGMEESTFIYPASQPALRTTPHVWDDGPSVSAVYPYNRCHAPSSTLNSSVVEMTRWLLANLGHGELDGTRILSAESHDLMWTPSVEDDALPSVGLSWFLGEYRGERLVTHSGGDLGYVSDLVMLPDCGLGVVAACNYDQMPIQAVTRGVLDIYLGNEPEVPKLPASRAFARVLEDQGIDAARAEYRRLQAEEAEDYSFGPGQLNRLGYSYLRNRDDVATAIEVFRFNAELYPEDANCHDSLGDAYRATGNLERAIASYRAALELDPDFAASKKNLEDLGVPAG
jgi:CubicO group peptidase (beta-lactamase class C family)